MRRMARLGDWPKGQAYMGKYRDLRAGAEAGSLTGVLERFAGPLVGAWGGADGIDVDALVLAKNYVASLSDTGARALYRKVSD